MIHNHNVDQTIHIEDNVTDIAQKLSTPPASSLHMDKALEAVKDMLGLPSSSALAAKMGISPQRILTWKKRNTLAPEFVEFCINQNLDLNQIFDAAAPCPVPSGEADRTDPSLSLKIPDHLREAMDAGADLCLLAGCIRPPLKHIKSLKITSDQIVSCLHMHLNFLEHAIHVLPQHIALIRIIGNNMAPWVTDGDMVIIDTSLTTIVNDAPYILQYDGVLVAKRLVRRQDGMILAKSDSLYCEEEVFAPESLPKIVGRIVRRLVR